MLTAPPTEASFLATRRGKLTLALLCGIAFLDFVDGSITNVALPSIRRSLHFSVDGLTWVLGGRLADLLGRRRVLVTGIATIAISSLIGGLAQTAGVLVCARLAQGLGAALTLPTALSILTTKFAEGKDRNTALGAWGGTGGLASALGVLLGGVLTEGPGWRWVMFVALACALLLPPVFRLVEGEHSRRRLVNFDAVGAVLVTGGMLVLVYALVRAPIAGWESGQTMRLLAGAAAVLAALSPTSSGSRHRSRRCRSSGSTGSASRT
jgi:MFS family permease